MVCRASKTVPDLLERMEIVPGGCFEWSLSLGSMGYGQVWHESRRWGAHRLMMHLLGYDVSETNVLHKCDNRKCIRPDHLFLGTQKDNMIDKCKKGRNSLAVLSEDDVRSIRSRYVKGCRKNGGVAISRYYGITPTQVQNIVKRKQWAWLDDKPEDDQ